MKLGKALEDNERFMQMMAVDPVALMTQRGVEQQSEVMTQFNDKWAGEMKKYKGILPQEKWIEMRKDRIGVESIQGGLGASQQRYLEELKQFRSNPRKYDEEAFLTASKNFYDSGEYETGLRAKPAIFIDAYNKSVSAFHKRADVSTQKTGTQDGMNQITTTTGTPEQGKQEFLNFLLGSDPIDSSAYLEYLTGQYFSQDPNVQKKYYDAAYDTDQSGSISRKEAMYDMGSDDLTALVSNPIVRWATETFGEGYVKKDQTLKNPPGSGVFGQKVRTPGKQGSTRTYGDRTYTSLYDFDGSLKLQNIPTSGGVTLRGRNSAAINTKGNVEGYLKHYDAEKDVLIIAATGTDPNIDSGTLMEIPVGNLNQAEVEKLPIEVDGKMTTVGAIRGNKPAVAKKKLFNPKTGKFE
jgi:hypothetical protein